MIKILFLCISLVSIQAFACEPDSKSQIEVDTWFGLFQSKQLGRPFGEAGALKLNETGLGQMNPHELLLFSQDFHKMLRAYGHRGNEAQTVHSIKALLKDDATVCDLGKALDLNYSEN